MDRAERRSEVYLQAGLFENFSDCRVGQSLTRVHFALGNRHVSMLFAIDHEYLQFPVDNAPRDRARRDDRFGFAHLFFPREFRAEYSDMSVS
ncbi:unannotated protein [freshwater metagenome]|uniref:Unannotated protein n=1 Tax=freshwater metagenome TaxID=449393 RepID=A0A6J6B0U9_9ZZZZ